MHISTANRLCAGISLKVTLVSQTLHSYTVGPEIAKQCATLTQLAEQWQASHSDILTFSHRQLSMLMLTINL